MAVAPIDVVPKTVDNFVTEAMGEDSHIIQLHLTSLQVLPVLFPQERVNCDKAIFDCTFDGGANV